MKTLFTVTMIQGKGWLPDTPRRAQPLWEEHAAFMDDLTTSGVVVLGGPLEDADYGDILLIVNAPDEAAITNTFTHDPWTPLQILEITKIQQWTIFLEAR